MKTFLCLTSIASVGALLAGCATGPGYYSPRAGPIAVGYDGWYDGNYGPIYDGYWRDGYFWWRDSKDHPYQRDDGKHFRHDPSDGFKHIRGDNHGSDHGGDQGGDMRRGPG